MKKLLTIMFALVGFVNISFSQSDWVSQIPKECFCCGDKIYNLPNPPPINGPSVLSCDRPTTYSTMNCPGATITWSVSPSVSFTGNGTSSITITGPYYSNSYTITVQIRCGNKTVTNQIVVRPDTCLTNPGFSMASNGSSVTVTATATNCTHYWFLVKDNDGSCSYTSGDTFVGPVTTASVSFPSLINNQQYTIYHFVYCKCGRYCNRWGSQIMCFQWLPAQQLQVANGAKGVKKIKEFEIKEFKEIPKEFKKEFPKEFQQQ